jgi:tRNA-specific 2-thiouridylase
MVMGDNQVVVVAMSGGVDSSVAAALLVEQGYTVIGMMLRLWSETDSDRANRCCSPYSMAMARRVAAQLSIPFYVLDARQFFYDQVVEPFLTDYAKNLTPNPCISCNRFVRWDFLFRHALTASADFLATGHYARLQPVENGYVQLVRGSDSLKDQSYVLHVLSQYQLKHTLFPLGRFTKPEVRQLARQYNLPVAEKEDSQDLCFLGEDGDYRKFLARHRPNALVPGPIIDIQGNTLGYHQGLPLFTIGQRKGLQISSPTPLYVLNKDKIHNALIVGSQDLLGRSSLVAKQVNWISGEPPRFPFEASVKIRYRARDVHCLVEQATNDNIRIQFDKPIRDITAGQAAVLYNGDVCLGGGIITTDLE